jgi:clan AA aspartic protease (TIGR02281 family)
MKRLAVSIVLFTTALLCTPAEAEIYKWTDDTGVVHYAGDKSSVPAKYRKRVKQMKELSEPNLKKEKASKPSTDKAAAGEELPEKPAIYLVRAARYGNHFLVTAEINSRFKGKFIVDTGATMVALTRSQAREFRLSIGSDVPKAPFNTAAGISWQPLLVLDSVKLGGAEVRDVEASVMDSEGEIGLLGMSFLNEFRVSFNNRESTMTLTRHDSEGESYGGYDGNWWERKFLYYTNNIRAFRREQKKIEQRYEQTGKSDVERNSNYQNLGKAVVFYKSQLEKLDRRASRAGVPKKLRRYPQY